MSSIEGSLEQIIAEDNISKDDVADWELNDELRDIHNNGPAIYSYSEKESKWLKYV